MGAPQPRSASCFIINDDVLPHSRFYWYGQPCHRHRQGLAGPTGLSSERSHLHEPTGGDGPEARPRHRDQLRA